MKLTAAAALAAALTMIGSAPALAASGAAQDVVDSVGHRIAQTGRATGHAAAGLGRSVGHATAQTGRDVVGDGPSHRSMRRHHRMRHHRHAG